MLRGAQLLLVIALMATAAAAAPSKTSKPECDGVLNHPGCRHTQRIPVFRVSAAPLKRGFIDDTIIRKPNKYATERYYLRGARPNATYQVRLQIHVANPLCGGTAFTQPSAKFKTGPTGRGKGGVVAPGPGPGHPNGPPPAPAIQNLVNGIAWQFVNVATGQVEYQTNCIPVFENPPKKK
jgi:hypothetical protein